MQFTTSFACLVLALTTSIANVAAVSQNYRVKSEKTLFYLSTVGESDNAILLTRNGADSVPPDTVLTFSDVVSDKPSIVTISGPRGLFAAFPDDATSGTAVIWSETPYKWTVNPTIQADKSITYQFTPSNGQNLFMWDSWTIGTIVIGKPGEEIIPPESFFTLTTA